ncbi:MAG: hypothetical protein GY772_05220, partial [bacterium]|nr:hypothetical protein [bacterium]
MLRRRPQVEANAHREANAALKAIRFVSTDRAPAVAGAPPQAAQPYWDLTEAEDIPVLAWEYFEAGGPAGLWGGETVRWSWRNWVAGLSPPLYQELFAACSISRFVARSIPGLLCPLPGMEGEHWEFQVTRSDGRIVGVHPPGKRGRVMHSFAEDAERRAALAAVAGKGLSQRTRAVYFDTAAPRRWPKPPQEPPSRVETGLLLGGRVVVEAALAAGPPAPTGSVAGFVALAKSVRELAKAKSAT